MSAALSLPAPASPTCALVYADEALIRRNRIIRKVAKRGVVVKKELQATTKRFDFTTVDLVIVIVDGVQQSNLNNIEADAKIAGKPVIRLPHQESRGWEALDRHVPAIEGPTSIVPADADPDDAELYAMLERERDEAREEAETLRTELLSARADRDAATAASEKWLGSYRRAEAALESAKLGEKEALDRTKNAEAAASSLRGRLTTIEGELAAARSANERLVTERDAAREAIDRQENAAATMAETNRKLDESEKVRADLKKRLEETKATIGEQSRKIETLQKKLDAAPAEHLRKINDLTARLETAEEALAARPETPATDAPSRLEPIVESLSTLVVAGLLKKEDAFDKVMEAARRG